MAAPKKYRITDSVLYKIHRLSRSLLKAAMKSAVANFDLTVPEIRVLSVISSHAPLASSVVVEVAAMDKALVSRALDKLLQRKLVAVIADPGDQRKYIWTLSRAGEILAGKVHALRQQRQARFLACVSDAEQRFLKDMLDRLFESSEAVRAAEAAEIGIQRRRGKRASGGAAHPVASQRKSA